jgi:hypothetical protein
LGKSSLFIENGLFTETVGQCLNGPNFVTERFIPTSKMERRHCQHGLQKARRGQVSGRQRHRHKLETKTICAIINSRYHSSHDHFI